MAAAIMVCLQLYIAQFQHLQNLFIKIIIKNAYYSQNSKIFDNWLLILKTGSSFHKQVTGFSVAVKHI